ncbi:MAG TPA: hypothetical protein VNE59_04030 [Burkholderiales bacterium]|nr:hypothetical protein [Burkholderiales bacterium]
MLKIAAFVLAAAFAGYGLHAVAQHRIDLRPAVTPVGTSSSGGISFAWFYDATNRAVYVCRVAQANSESVDCKGEATLP